MSAYVIVQVVVDDPEVYARYREMVPRTIEQYGGRFIVRGGQAETLEGDWDPGRMVVLEFESVERAKAWWSSEEYAPAKALRQTVSSAQMIVVEGV